MDLVDKIKDIASRIAKTKEHIKTEEATKNAYIMPFISALGYDVFNPLEVIPEFISDVGTKKGEKVDYAIKKDEKIIILVECKSIHSTLNSDHLDQLYRYFSVTESRFAILTNGLEYWFYSDIYEPNKMDSKPFFTFNISEFREDQIDELKKFARSTFNLDEILGAASDLKYTNAIKKYFSDLLSDPSDEFVRVFAGNVYSGRLKQNIIDQFRVIVKKALGQHISEKISDRLKSALESESIKSDQSVEKEAVKINKKEDGIITTEEELEGYNIIKAILRDTVPVERITLRDTKSYCGVLFDDNNRKPLCRLYFNSSRKYLSLFDDEKKEDKKEIPSLNEIFLYSDNLKKTASKYMEEMENSRVIKENSTP